MTKRSIFILSLTFAFLMSAWGNVITAAFCPHYLSNQSCIHKSTSANPQRAQRQESCHHDMDDMKMGSMQMEESEMDSDREPSPKATFEDIHVQLSAEVVGQQLVIDLPIEPCSHCWMHSQPTSGTSTLVAIDPLKQVVETNAPPADASIDLPQSFTVSIAPLEHGPPGNVLPRYVLISVFRI